MAQGANMSPKAAMVRTQKHSLWTPFGPIGHLYHTYGWRAGVTGVGAHQMAKRLRVTSVGTSSIILLLMVQQVMLTEIS